MTEIIGDSIDKTTENAIRSLKKERREIIRELVKESVGVVAEAGSWPLIGYAAGYLYAMINRSPEAAQYCGTLGSIGFGTFAVIGTLFGMINENYIADNLRYLKDINKSIKEKAKGT